MAAGEPAEKVGAIAGSGDADEDDPPLLSSNALQALKEFLAEQLGGVLGADDGGCEEGGGGEVELVAEDWRLSQFWYDKETAETVAAEVRCLGASPVACIACPTLFAYLKKIDPTLTVQLLEFDARFEKYGKDFTFYDYNHPEELPPEMRHHYQVVIADPPYLVKPAKERLKKNAFPPDLHTYMGGNEIRIESKECLEKVAKTISFLLRPGQSYLLLLTGEVQTELAAELLGLHPCNFRPCHASKLGNSFRLFTNYDPVDRLGGWDQAEVS